MKVANIALGLEPGRRVSVSEKGPLSPTPPVARMLESDRFVPSGPEQVQQSMDSMELLNHLIGQAPNQVG
jgi:hypothetical protein